MKIIIFLLLLAGCSNMPTTEDGPQCSPVFKYVTSLEGDEYISVKDSYCICRSYRFSLNYIGMVPGTSTWQEPIKYCEKIVGWTPGEYAKKAAYWEAVRQSIIKARKK